MLSVMFVFVILSAVIVVVVSPTNYAATKVTLIKSFFMARVPQHSA
jgi:hypothetical protein